ncbi:MAG: J domain-containing protein [bacterium]
MPINNFYKILGLHPQATEAEIKSAFRALAKKFHPDKVKGSSQDQRFSEIVNAYKVLSNKSRRFRYDAERRLAERDKMDVFVSQVKKPEKKARRSVNINPNLKMNENHAKVNSIFIIGLYVVLLIIIIMLLR